MELGGGKRGLFSINKNCQRKKRIGDMPAWRRRKISGERGGNSSGRALWLKEGGEVLDERE